MDPHRGAEEDRIHPYDLGEEAAYVCHRGDPRRSRADPWESALGMHHVDCNPVEGHGDHIHRMQVVGSLFVEGSVSGMDHARDVHPESTSSQSLDRSDIERQAYVSSTSDVHALELDLVKLFHCLLQIRRSFKLHKADPC